LEGDGSKGIGTDFLLKILKMELTGRLTGDAVSSAVGDKNVLNFSVADNDSYKPKGALEYKKITTFFACSLWQSGKVQQVLRKGTIVTMQGRMGTKAYLTKKGEPASELTFHVNGFKVVAFAKKEEEFTDVVANKKREFKKDEPEDDDLPF
jgi:single-strand DNA-binding protein